MPELSVTIKWQKEVWKDTKVNTDEGLDAFQAVVFSLSQVPADRQKLICKGKLLKDDASVKALKKGAKVFLTGTADEVPTGPSKEILFVEDMPEAQQQSMQGSTSAGLQNLGNTCYMNSTLQCLRHVPELRVALNRFQPTQDEGEQHFIAALGQLFRDLDNSSESVVPSRFVGLMRKLYAQFNEVDDHGHHRQQDADEFLTTLLGAIGRHVTNFERDQLLPDKGSNVAAYLCGGQLVSMRKCDESEEEPVRSEKKAFLKLTCAIDSGVNFLYQGLQKGMEEKMRLTSSVLGREASFTRRSQISELPRVLVIQFLRFSWGSARKEGFQTKDAKALKILKKVEYPDQFDIKEFCEQDLQNSMAYARARLKEEKDKELGLADNSTKKKKTKKQKGAAALSSSEPKIKEATPCSTSGFYEITGVVTHQGRAADGGHYIGWSKDSSGSWWRYDDAKVTPAKLEDIKNLCGGGDWHTAFLVFYRRVDDLKERPKTWWKYGSDDSSPSPGDA